MGHREHRMRIGKETPGPQRQRLDRVSAEMLVEPRIPLRPHGVARLQDRPHPRAAATAHQAEMAAVTARHQFQNGIGLAVAANAKDESLVAPLHGGR